MYTVSVQVSWEAAHRLVSAYSEECKANIHGHSYRAIVTVGCDWLNDDRMVCDFKKFKEIIHKAIKGWDHAIFLYAGDPLWGPINEAGCRIITCADNPTAETMAKMLITNTDWDELGINIQYMDVVLYETADNFARVTEEINSAHK